MSIRLVHVAFAVLTAAALVAGCGRDDPAKFLASAESYIAKNNFAAAAIELKNALAAAPDNARARFLLGKALLEGGDASGAMLELRKALDLRYPADEVYPLLARSWALQGAANAGAQELLDAPLQSAQAKAEVLVVLANVDLDRGRVAEASAKVDKALALDPASVGARLAQARVVAARNDIAGGLKLVDGLLADTPDRLDVLMVKSQFEIALGKRDEAKRTLQHVVTLRPNAVQARYVLASLHIQSKEVDEAAAQVEVLKKQIPKDARTLQAMALVAYTRGDNAAALDAVQQSLQAAPNFLPARYLSGLVDLRRGAYESAEQSFRVVLNASPGDSGARSALAQTFLARGQAASARETLQPVLDKHPDDVAALRLAGEIELALKRPDRAEEFIEHANRLESNNVKGRVRLAQVRMAKGETAEGINDLQRMAAADTTRSEPDLALIQTYIQRREFDKALAAADALIKKEPRNAAAYNAKGTVYAVQADLKNARQAYESAIAIDPNYTGALLNLASADAIERKYEDAIKRYQQILAKDPKSERALMGIAQVKMISGAKPEEVIAQLQQAVEANPTSPAPRQALVSYYSMRKDWKGAIAAGQTAAAALPDVPALLESLAAAQVAGGEKNQAIQTYTRLARLQQDNAMPWLRIGAIHASLKSFDEAIDAFRNAITIAPTNATIWIALAASYKAANKIDAGFTEARRLQKDLATRIAGYGLEAELLAAQKKMPEALAAYRDAFRREPLPAVVVRMAGLLTAMGKSEEADAMTRKWIDEHPKDVIVRTYLGEKSIAKGDFKAAAGYLRAAQEIDPRNLTLLNDLAWALAQVKDPSAVDYAQRAYHMAPESASVSNTYGWALFRQGDTERGLRMLRRAVDLDPANPNLRLYLAKALIESGDKPGARKELEIASSGAASRVRDEAKQLLQSL